MSWFRLDDQGAFHEKVLAAGNEAYGAWCRAGQWSSGHGTEGRISRSTALTIARQRIWERLVDTRLCDSLGDEGWQIHDFLHWNPTAEDVAAKRQARADAGRKGGIKKAANRQSSSSKPSSENLAIARPVAWQNSAPSPSPSPSPIQEIESCAPAAPKPNRSRRPATKEPELPLPADFAVSPEVEAICRAEGLPNPHDVLPDFRDWADEKQVLKARWEATFRRWMRSPITQEKYPKWAASEPELPILRLAHRELLIPRGDDAPDMTGFSFGATR